MCVCGYNQRMGDGITLLFEGMYEAIFAKSRAEGISFRDILHRELIEIPRISASLQRSRDAALTSFRGLNMMALAILSELLEHPERDPSDKKVFMSGVARFIAVLEETETYNVQLPPASPRNEREVAERASGVGDWVMDRFCSESV